MARDQVPGALNALNANIEYWCRQAGPISGAGWWRRKTRLFAMSRVQTELGRCDQPPLPRSAVTTSGRHSDASLPRPIQSSQPWSSVLLGIFNRYFEHEHATKHHIRTGLAWGQHGWLSHRKTWDAIPVRAVAYWLAEGVSSQICAKARFPCTI